MIFFIFLDTLSFRRFSSEAVKPSFRAGLSGARFSLRDISYLRIFLNRLRSFVQMHKENLSALCRKRVHKAQAQGPASLFSAQLSQLQQLAVPEPSSRASKNTCLHSSVDCGGHLTSAFEVSPMLMAELKKALTTPSAAAS